VTPDRTDTPASDATAPGDGMVSMLDESLNDEVVRQSMDAVVLTDLTFRVRVWNPAAEQLYGVPASTAVGRRIREIVVPFELDGEPIDGADVLADLEAGGPWRRRAIHRPVGGPLAGQDVIVDAQVSLLRGPDGRAIGVLGVNRDVTDSARLESEMAALGSLIVATDRAPTRPEVAMAALEILCRATGADAGLVAMIENGVVPAAQLGLHQETIDVVMLYGQVGGPLSRILATPDAYVSTDIASAPLSDTVRAAVAADGLEHLIAVGLHLSGRLTGFLTLGWRHRAPREPSRAVLHQAAALIAAAMENARLLAAVEHGLTEERLLTRRMRALVELTRLPKSAPVDASGIERLMRDVGATIGADASAHARVEGDRLVLDRVHDLDWGRAEALINRPIASVPMAAALIGGAAAALFSLTDPVISTEGAAATAAGYRSAAAFAIREDEQLTGVLFAIFRRPIDELEIDERTLDSIGRVLDISFANRRLREVVDASERRYRQLFEGSPDALLVQSSETVVDANPAALRLFGGALIGRPMSDLLVEELPRTAAEALDPSASTQSTGHGRRLDGSTFPSEVDRRPIEIDGQPRRLAIVRDLTERTRMQAELIQAQKMDAIGLLVAGVAHELNNPLAAIVGFSHLLRTDPNLPGDLRSQADLLVQEANRTRVIVQNLLDFARQRPPERVVTELGPLIESVIGLQSYVLAHNNLTVDVDLAADLPALLVDRSQIQQVLINLTVNAAQAMRDLDRPGAIRIAARPILTERGPAVRIEISDNGPGVPEAILDRLFMPFVTTKEPGSGTGLGLSVSFGIVASHGGTLRHEGNADGGATFVIELPVGHDAARDRARRSGGFPAPEDPATPATRTERALPETPPLAAAAAEPSSDATGRPIRVLVLDDEPSIRDLLGRLLVKMGREPILTGVGAAALEIVRTDPPDAILCDHRMAGMSGIEFHAEVMAIAPELGARFAFMSGDVLNPALRDFAEAHGVQLLAKPFDVAAVTAMVDVLIRAGSD
jgi:PAS domain S-box-containing protein